MAKVEFQEMLYSKESPEISAIKQEVEEKIFDNAQQDDPNDLLSSGLAETTESSKDLFLKVHARDVPGVEMNFMAPTAFRAPLTL